MSISKTSSKWFIIGRVLLFYIISIIIFATVSGLTKKSEYPDHFCILFSAMLTFVLVIVFSKWEKLKLKEVGIAIQKNSFLRFSAGLGIGIALVIIQVAIVSNTAAIHFSLSANTSVLSIISPLLLYFVVALREELVFRSYSLRNLANSIHPILALLFITTIFILEHIIAGIPWKMAIIGSGFGGILFGLSALKTKGLALQLGIHFSWNFAQWMFGFKGNYGIWKEVVKKGQEAHAENVALTAFVITMIIGISAILTIYRNQKI